MTAELTALLNGLAGRSAFAPAGALASGIDIMRASIGDGIREALDLQDLFDAAESAAEAGTDEDRSQIGALGEIESIVGAFDDRLRALRDMLQVIGRDLAKLQSVEVRIAAPLLNGGPLVDRSAVKP